jgi:hypothetical protein
MTSYGVPSDTVPHDGFPYYADLCPACQEPRPFRIEEADDGETTGTCAVCGLVREYHFMDSPGTSPEADDDDDEVTDDAMTVVGGIVQDEPDELVAWCPGCHCERTFTILPDSEVEGDVDPDWTYWCCVMCQCAPGAEPEPAPYVKPPVIMHDDPSWATPRPPGEWMARTRHRCVPSCRAEAS